MLENLESGNFRTIATVAQRAGQIAINTPGVLSKLESSTIYYINFPFFTLEFEELEDSKAAFALRLKTKDSINAITLLSDLKFIRISCNVDRKREVIKFYLEYSKESAEPWCLKSEIIEIGLGLRR